MKKFYENPVVEITVFDVEDVITASNVVDTTTNPTAAVTAIESAINAAGTKPANTVVAAVKTYGAYKW